MIRPARHRPAKMSAMVLEHALIDVAPGREDDFLAAYLEATKVISACAGFISAQIHRGVESPSRFLLLVEWATLDDHLVGFRQSEAFVAWRALIGPFFASTPAVDHFEASGPRVGPSVTQR